MGTKDISFVLTFDDKGTPQVRKIVKETRSALDKLDSSAKKVGSGFNHMTSRVKNANAGMGRFKTMLKSTWGQMAMGMGVMMGVQGVIRGIRMQLTKTLQVGRDFEDAWANVTTMLTISQEATADLKTELLHLSPILGSTTDLAKGMYQVLSASIEPAKAIKFLGEAAKSAAAGATDTFTAVDALTTVINAYGLATEEATRISDIMFQTVKMGKLTYEGMAGALGTVVPIAAKVGIKFESIGAAMATLTKQGIDVRTATVSLRQVLVGVLKPTSEAEAMAKKLGIEFNSAALKSKGLVKFLLEIKEKTMGDAEAMTALFGNVRALIGVMALAGSQMGEFILAEEQMAAAAGSTEEAFKKRMASVSFWMKTYKNMFDKMRIAIWKGFTDPMKKGIKSSEDFEKKIGSLTKKLIKAGIDIGKSIQGIIQTIKGLKDIIISTIKVLVVFWALKKLQAWSAAFRLAMIGASRNATMLGGAIKGASLAMRGLGAGVQIAAAAFIGWEIGKVISKITGLEKAAYGADVAIVEWGEKVEDSAKMQEKLREALKDSGVTIHEARRQWGSYGKALIALTLAGRGWLDELFAIREAQRKFVPKLDLPKAISPEKLKPLTAPKVEPLLPPVQTIEQILAMEAAKEAALEAGVANTVLSDAMGNASMVGATFGLTLEEIAEKQRLWNEQGKEGTETLKQQAITLETVGQMWNNVVSDMATSIMDWGELTGSIFKNVGKIFGNFVQSAIKGIGQLVVAQLIASKKEWLLAKTTAIAKGIASVFKSIPFPLNIALAAGAIGIITTLFSKIAKFEKGGIAGLHGPELILVGEKGPEEITPLRGGESGARRTTSTQDVRVQFSVNYEIDTLDTISMRDVVRNNLGPEFITWVERNRTEFRRALGL